MFCNKCGTLISKTANFCNGCGNEIRNQENESDMQFRTMQTQEVITKKKKLVKGLKGGIIIWLVVIVFIMLMFWGKERENLYGAWTDANANVTLCISEEGIIRIYGAEYLLGAKEFQYTKEDKILYLQGKGPDDGVLNRKIEYDLSKTTLKVIINGQELVLYRRKNVEIYGTWLDPLERVVCTFYEDGRISIIRRGNDAEEFYFEKIEDGKLLLKTEQNYVEYVYYEIIGNVMRITIDNDEYKLMKNE